MGPLGKLEELVSCGLDRLGTLTQGSYRETKSVVRATLRDEGGKLPTLNFSRQHQQRKEVRILADMGGCTRNHMGTTESGIWETSFQVPIWAIGYIFG